MKLSRRLIPALIAILLLISSCSSVDDTFKCEDAIGCVEIKPGEPIQIGVLQTFSGALKSNGVDQLRGIRFALADRDGKILGHPVKFQKQDSLCSAEGGTTAALRITADPQCLGILGTYCSGAAVTASKIVSAAGLVMISATNTSPNLTSVAGKPGANYHAGYFRTAHNDTALGIAVAEFARRKLKLEKAATIHDGDPYTAGLAKAFSSSFKNLGGKITLETVINKEDMNMRPVLAAVLQSNPQIVFFPVFRPAGDYITQQSAQIKGFEKIIRVTADGLFNDAFLSSNGSAGNGMYFALPAMPEGQAYAEFVQRYKREHRQAPLAGQHAHAFDAANLLFDAIEKAAFLKKDRTLYVKRQALRDALSATDTKGLTGQLTCDQYGDCGNPQFNIVRLEDPTAGLERLASNIVFRFSPRP